MNIIPIWKDYPITIATSEAYVDYEIQLEDGTTIYTGRAFKLPGADSVQIIPNEICAPYVAVTGEMPTSGEPVIENMARTFTLTEAGGAAHPFTFSADYSYLPALAGASNDPITGKVSRNQKAVISMYNTGTGVLHTKFTNAQGDVQEFDTPFANPAFTTVLDTSKVNPKYDTVVFSTDKYSVQLDIVDTCARYILYYVNAFGAWDSLLVDGMVKKTDEYARTTFKKSYTTTAEPLQPRGTVDIQNDITRQYSLVTGWLSDEESGRMHHLLGSTNVYLYDTVTGEYLPVVLTASSCEYKTYRNQGAHLVNYTIEATAAQNYTRR